MKITESDIVGLIKIANDVYQNNDKYKTTEAIKPIADIIIRSYGNKLLSVLHYLLNNTEVSAEQFRNLGVLFSILMFFTGRKENRAGCLFFMLGRYCFMSAFQKSSNNNEKQEVMFQFIRMLMNSYNSCKIPLADTGRFITSSVSYSEEILGVLHNVYTPEVNYGESVVCSSCLQYYLSDYLINSINYKHTHLNHEKLYQYNEKAQDILKQLHIELRDAVSAAKIIIKVYQEDFSSKAYEDGIENLNSISQYDLFTLELEEYYGKQNLIFHDFESEIQETISNCLGIEDNFICDNTETNLGGKYRGSYAQDEMGYSDDDIDTILDGDPDAYWNIDR